MVMPTVASSPTAAMPTPYSPAKVVETRMMAQMASKGITTDCMPTAKPVIITVAAPVSPALAMRITGFEEV